MIDIKMKKSYLIVIMIVLLAGCSNGKKQEYPLPKGSIEKINSDSNEISPIQLVDEKLKDGCSQEFAEEKNIGEIAAGNDLLSDLITNKQHIQTESIGPLNDNHGIIAVAHPPDSLTKILMNLDLGGIVGGTDLFEYEIKGNKKYFDLLKEPINSITWDSHPYIVNLDGNTQLMLWASDRADNLGGYSLPFFRVPYVNFVGDTIHGNSDIYYCFRVGGKWQQVKNLEVHAKGINTGFDEVTPSLFCLCYKTKLLFASNRNNSQVRDFDIYTADVIVDADRQEIHLDGKIEMLSKGLNQINTEHKEFYPMVGRPYGDSLSLYFASDRYSEPTPTEEGTVQSMGGMDLYEMPTDIECRPAKIKYEVVLLDAEDSTRAIPLPYIKIFNEDGTRQLAAYDTNVVNYDFKFGRKYLISGGSYYFKIECTGGDSVIQYYVNDFTKIVDQPLGKQLLNDSLPMIEIKKGLKSSTYAKPSEYTKLKAIPESFPRNDTLIRDTIYIHPSYYHFPPCKWEFTENLEKYRRNVPYFQTGFWEVNTKRNLSRHMRLFSRKHYRDASFIELHPKNQYFGDERGNLTEEQKKLREKKRLGRLYEYENYAKTVDQNIADMAEEIGETILTAFDELRDNVPQSDSRLVVQVHAYSDLRPIKKGEYLGDSTVEYISCFYDQETASLLTSKVKIQPKASLVGESNETLSELRAYFGYKELMKKLMEFPKFKAYYDRGEVLIPDGSMSEEEYRRAISEKTIVIMVQGMQVDESGRYEIAGYKRRTGDFYELDEIRRINVIIDRMEIIGKKLKTSECCSE